MSIRPNLRRESRFTLAGKAQLENACGGVFAYLRGATKALPIVNFSTTGAQLLSAKKFGIGDEFSFHIKIPLLGTAPLRVGCRVIWVKTISIFGKYMVGVRFVEMNMDARKRLKNLVDFLKMRMQNAYKKR